MTFRNDELWKNDWMRKTNIQRETQAAGQSGLAGEGEGLCFDMESYSCLVSHELKTPIREIELYAEFIEEDSGEVLSPQSMQDIRSIHRICDNMLDLIQNIMEYSRVSYKMLHREVIDMRALIGESFDQLMESEADRTVTLEIKSLPNLIGDVFLIKQLVNNILSNSIKYTKDEPQAHIVVYSYEDNTRVAYCFQDNGAGIDPRDSGAAFDMFERMHSESKFDGNGIGLALVKKIAERFGADVEILGKANQGCTLTLRCPSNLVIPAQPRQETGEKERARIRVGIIGDYSGACAGLEASKKAAYELAAEEINRGGGICGKQVELLFKYDKSDIILSEEHARTFTEIDKVDVLMGALLSPNREAIRGVVDKTKTLYFYNELYEGGVADHYTFCVSTSPEHYIYPVVEYLMQHFGKRLYVVVADYIWGIVIAECIKAFVKDKGGEVVAVEYFPTAKTNFRVTIENIVEEQPDVLVYLGVGNNHNGFHTQWWNWGLPEIPLISPNCINEWHLHRIYKPPIVENVYFMASFIDELQTEQAARFLKSFRKRYSEEDIPYIGSEAEAAYTSLYLYKSAVELAGTTETEAVISALESDTVSFDGPGGTVRVRGVDHHVVRDCSLFRVKGDHSIEMVERYPSLMSDFVETAIEQHMGVQGGLKALGTHAPNLQYSLMYYKVVNVL